MNRLKEGWFSEFSDALPGACTSYNVRQVLFQTKSDFQDVMVIETESHGLALVLDGFVQCTQFDEFAYQEMISFLPLCSHPSPKRVLIVGGGDGGVAREVCKMPQVENVDLVEIDSVVVEVSKKYLPEMGVGFNHPKLNLHIEDGFQFLQSKKEVYDIIITDSSDPVGPAVALFEKSYFQLLYEGLKPGGVICNQGGTYWENMEIVKKTFDACRQVFPTVAYAITCVPTYPTGQIGLVLASKDTGATLKEPVQKLTDKQVDDMGLRYYSSDVHRGAFCLPTFAVKALYS